MAFSWNTSSLSQKPFCHNFVNLPLFPFLEGVKIYYVYRHLTFNVMGMLNLNMLSWKPWKPFILNNITIIVSISGEREEKLGTWGVWHWWQRIQKGLICKVYGIQELVEKNFKLITLLFCHQSFCGKAIILTDRFRCFVEFDVYIHVTIFELLPSSNIEKTD